MAWGVYRAVRCPHRVLVGWNPKSCRVLGSMASSAVRAWRRPRPDGAHRLFRVELAVRSSGRIPAEGLIPLLGRREVARHCWVMVPLGGSLLRQLGQLSV